MQFDRRSLAYYITPHGFGHAVRSLEVIRRLLLLEPDLNLILVSDIPDFIVEQNLGRLIPYRKKRLDVGLVQKDSLQFDLKASRDALEKLRSEHNSIVTEEVAFFMNENIDLVVSDIPFLAFYAASECGIPSIGIGNFTWDWIYEAFGTSDERWRPLIPWIREGYNRCDLFLQLPMHGDCTACPNILDVPLVARKAGRSREETRKILGCRPERKLYLLSFTDLHLDREAQKHIERMKDILFLFKHPLRYDLSNGMSLDGFDLSYTDVVAAVDAVITKPGYGIVSDCLSHGTPIIYTDRGSFAEYEILVEEIENSLTAVFISPEDLYAGLWEQAIRKMDGLPRRVPELRTDGASVCARMIIERLPERIS